MNSSHKPLGPLKLENIFNLQEQVPPLEMLAASLISQRMFWPEPTEDRNSSLYFALCLRKIHGIMLEDLEQDQAQMGFTAIVKRYFGGWMQYTENLALVNFPSQGKGSLAERAWQGTLAGMVFRYAFDHAVSLNAAAEAVSELTRTGLQGDEFANMLKPSPENIIKNYWTRFQSVAHFWAAMDFFVIPSPEDGLIRLDKAIPIPEVAQVRLGWRGIMDVAHDFLEKSADVKRYKTRKTLLDKETAFRVIFTE